MRDHLLERRTPHHAGPDQKRGLEPAAVLIMPLDVDRDRPTKLRSAFAHCQMRGAGVEPDVENVELLPERAGATLTGVAVGEKIRCRSIEPRIGSFSAEILAD